MHRKHTRKVSLDLLFITGVNVTVKLRNSYNFLTRLNNKMTSASEIRNIQVATFHVISTVLEKNLQRRFTLLKSTQKKVSESFCEFRGPHRLKAFQLTYSVTEKRKVYRLLRYHC